MVYIFLSSTVYHYIFFFSAAANSYPFFESLKSYLFPHFPFVLLLLHYLFRTHIHFLLSSLQFFTSLLTVSLTLLLILLFILTLVFPWFLILFLYFLSFFLFHHSSLWNAWSLFSFFLFHNQMVSGFPQISELWSNLTILSIHQPYLLLPFSVTTSSCHLLSELLFFPWFLQILHYLNQIHKPGVLGCKITYRPPQPSDN